MRASLAAAVVVLLSAIAVVFGPNLASLWELRQSGATTIGVIITVDPEDHNRATYRYRVHSSEYVGSEFGSRHKKGDSVMVAYSQQHPAISVLGDPARLFRECLAGTVLLLACVAVAGVVAALRAR